MLRARVAAACAAGLAGCGTPSGAERSTTTPSAQPGTTQPAATTTQPQSEEPSKVLARRTSSDDDIPLELQLNELKRDQSLLTLNFTVQNTGQPTDPSAPNAAGRRDRWQVSGFFDDGQSPPGDASQLRTVDGVYLLDPVGRKKYPVVHDSKRVCVCSGDTGSTFVSPGQSVRFYATFGAPAPDVRKVDVAVPHFGTITGVPIED